MSGSAESSQGFFSRRSFFRFSTLAGCGAGIGAAGFVREGSFIGGDIPGRERG